MATPAPLVPPVCMTFSCLWVGNDIKIPNSEMERFHEFLFQSRDLPHSVEPTCMTINVGTTTEKVLDADERQRGIGSIK